MLPTVAISMGDPAGIGPEVVIKALADKGISCLARWIIVGDESVLTFFGRMTGLVPLDKDQVQVLDLRQVDFCQFSPGKLSEASGRASIEYIRRATRLCLEGKADALVTAPVNKEAVSLSHPSFSGHTEFIAELCGAPEPRMMLVNDRLRIIHVSTHVSLRRACELNVGKVLETIRHGRKAMEDLGFRTPRIAVCGLNPHAGENGLFGMEDSAFIAPAVQAAQREGVRCEGPFPGDTIILKAVRGAHDLVVAMYHDQGHIPMKLLDFEHTVNLTIGLPVIRTSVDHGTAFDIAGKNQADPSSMKAGMALAAQIAARRLGGAPAQKPDGRESVGNSRH
jgi:4-phospho-D-threonate 3-dehydrogenase / 4-phospho-D-erythronate 3-dehydrogenase